MDERKSQLVKLLVQECASMQDIHDLLKNLFKGTIEEMLEAKWMNTWVMKNIAQQVI